MNKTVSLIYKICILAALLVAHLTGHAVARDIYVNNLAGDDRNRGERNDTQVPFAGPVQTIGKALHMAVGGDRVVVADTGTPYREEVSLTGERNSGANQREFVLDGGGATLDGSLPIPAKAWEHWEGDVFRFRPKRLGFQQLFLNERPAREHPITKDNWRLPALAPLEWTMMLGHGLLPRRARSRSGQLSRPSSRIANRHYAVPDSQCARLESDHAGLPAGWH